MLSGVDKQSGERLDDVNIRYQMNTFLIAGHETTSGMLSFAVYFLLNNPHVLQKAYEEVDRVLGRDVNAKPSAQQVNQLVYIGQILKESLRLWPTAPAFGLYPYQHETIGGKYKLRKRTFVTVLTAMLHRDKSVWGPQAEVFNPDNFAPEREAKMPPHAYKPFGNGQRACIGRQFAMTEATLVLGLILQRFRLVDHTRYQLKIKESLTIKPEGLVMRVRLRPDIVRGSGVSVAAKPAPAKGRAKKKAASHGTKLTVLFGSNMGTAEELARSIAEAGEAQGFATTLASLDDQAGKLPAEGAVAIVCASYNGGPPDNAGSLHQEPARRRTRSAEGRALHRVRLRQPRLGLDLPGDPAPDRRAFGRQGRGADLRARRRRRQGRPRRPLPGLERAAAAGPGRQARRQARARRGRGARAALPGAAGRQAAGQSHHRRRGRAADARARQPRAAECRQVGPQHAPYRGAAARWRQLSRRRSSQHRAAERRGAGRAGESGASASRPARTSCWRRPKDGARPCRSARRSRFIGCCRTSSSCSTRRRASRSRPWRSTRAVRSRGPSSRQLLDEEPFRAEILAKRKSVLDLLEEHPACELPFAAFLEMLPLMTPRYYSISSSPMADGTRCSITVAVVEGPARSGAGVYHGVCSSHLARQAAGGTVQAFVKETKVGFRLPVDPAAPIVMIGPGTGLAPFRGFLRERAALKAQGRSLGPAMLFFGCRHPEQDFIYADELAEHARAGIVDLHVAFSRHDGKKTYVQDLLKDQADRVRALIEQGAIVYVCGDGGRMEPDVKRALAAICGEAGVAKLAADNRYVLDVWASS